MPTVTKMLLGGYKADICEDIDSTFCQGIKTNRPDMCSNACISTVCKRSCGLCHDVTSCNTIQICPNSDDFCFTTQTFSDRFRETYRLGCASNNTCRQYTGISRTYRVNVDAGCCNTDKCNNKPPVLLQLKPAVTRSITNTTANFSTCMDIDQILCKNLNDKHSEVCTNDCISHHLCPNACSKCVQCLQCSAVSHPTECKTTTVCGKGQECFVTETLQMTSTGTQALQLGCTNEQICHQMNSTRHNSLVHKIFGRRQEQFVLRGGCCKGNMCNSYSFLFNSPNSSPSTDITNLQSATYTNQGTSQHVPSLSGVSKPVPTKPLLTTKSYSLDCSSAVHVRCPDTFYPYHGACFKTGPVPLTYTESKAYCEKQCLRLAEFDREAEMTAVTRNFLHHFNGAPLYVGAISKTSSPKWLWERGHLEVDVLMWVHYNGYGNCAVTRELITHSGKHRHSDFGLEDVNCTQRFKPLCQLFLRVSN
ncbi:uncharacterized protein LOC127725952 [Mytilus californianus]|uniref:uncharacterized protein LOC127725952 n=1 Tax=Mytilus californianus TaxID=6549 RepID=UPI0022471DB3|nr:uncharacterized protein LOC127725952 [Mytilus californianus]